MFWKILAVVLTLITVSGIPDLLVGPLEPRHWIGLGFSIIGLVGLFAYAFGWSILGQRFWFPFALAYAAWLAFGMVANGLSAWPLFTRGRSTDAAGLAVAICVPLLISVLQWLPVWRYANGRTVD